MNDFQNLDRRGFLRKSLENSAMVAGSLTGRWVEIPSGWQASNNRSNFPDNLFLSEGMMPRPKHRLYDTIKASVTDVEGGHDEILYLGVIVGLWWQPEVWTIKVGWVYQVFVLSTNSPYRESIPLMDFRETEITTNF